MIRILLFAVSFLFSVTHAAVTVDLYKATVPVEKRTSGFPDAIAQKAFEKVLVRVTGGDEVLSSPQVQSAMTHLQDYIQQYGYRNERDTSATSQTVFYASFDPASVKQLLSEANVHVWGDTRPLVILWIVVSDSAGKHIVTSAEMSEVSAHLNSLSKKYGVPIVLPAMDLEDVSKVSVADVESNNLQAIKKASQRYHADAILIGRVTSVGARDVDSFWRFYSGDNYYSRTINGHAKTEVVEDIMNQVVQLLAKNLSVSASHMITLKLAIDRVKTLQDIASLQNYLQKQDGVKRVVVTQVNGQRVIMTLTLVGNEQSFLNSVTADRRMVLLQTQGDDADLVFSL